MPRFDEMLMEEMEVPNFPWFVAADDYFKPKWMSGDVAYAMAIFRNQLTHSRSEE